MEVDLAAIDVTGALEQYSVTSDGPPVAPSEWRLRIKIDGNEYVGVTHSPIVFAVLGSALLTRNRWKIELSIADQLPNVDRVRVIDDREDICRSDLLDQPVNQTYLPLSPTFFGDESSPKWGFFFSVNAKCKEYKGISLDVYAVIARAWRGKNDVTLTFDGDLIVGAR
jgi:hypothetical protein